MLAMAMKKKEEKILSQSSQIEPQRERERQREREIGTIDFYDLGISCPGISLMDASYFQLT